MKCHGPDATCEVLTAHGTQEPQVEGKFCNACAKSKTQEIKSESRVSLFVYTRAIA